MRRRKEKMRPKKATASLPGGSASVALPALCAASMSGATGGGREARRRLSSARTLGRSARPGERCSLPGSGLGFFPALNLSKCLTTFWQTLEDSFSAMRNSEKKIAKKIDKS